MEEEAPDFRFFNPADFQLVIETVKK